MEITVIISGQTRCSCLFYFRTNSKSFTDTSVWSWNESHWLMTMFTTVQSSNSYSLVLGSKLPTVHWRPASGYFLFTEDVFIFSLFFIVLQQKLYLWDLSRICEATGLHAPLQVEKLLQSSGWREAIQKCTMSNPKIGLDLSLSYSFHKT